MSGYLHPLYVQSFSEIGTPLFLPRSKGWLVKREIPSTNYYDAMGPYPLFFCDHWYALIEDLNDLSDELVSVSLVIGPMMKFSKGSYSEYFDIFKEYKDHYILDLSKPLEETISKGRRRDSRRALRCLSVNLEISPNINLDEWVSLYENLIKRHKIKGIRAFSKYGFQIQLSIPNTHYFRVLHKDQAVGGNLFFIQNNVAYAHLSAFTDEGYELGAPYAVKWVALEYLSSLVNWINFGGSTHNEGDSISGLDKFKKGWSNWIEKSYYCGKILDREKYEEIKYNKGIGDNSWFPQYRSCDY